MVSGKIRQGNCRLQLSITTEANDLLRKHSPNQGDKSRIVDDLIKKKYGEKQSCPGTENSAEKSQPQ
jgi:hypothetical protein